MNDKTDPRLDVLRALWDCYDLNVEAHVVAERLDAADLASGIVRADTTDEALVERVAEVIYTELPRLIGVTATARAVLAELRGDAACG
jgi:hypothetical protein